MARSFDALVPEYMHLWASCQIRPERRAEVSKVARDIVRNRGRYERVAQRTGVPWYVTGIIHAMECSKFPAFTQHLHNGDPLERKTRLVPAGRPLMWPPEDGSDLWEESAVDALTMKGKQFDRIKDWSVERIAYVLETYNGWGYRGKGINSPYLWSYSNQYKSGKYVADHVWSATAVSGQCGGMAVLKALIEIEPDLMGAQPAAQAVALVERAWPAAEEKKPSYAAVAKTSGTVKLLFATICAKLTLWLDTVFDVIPSAAAEMEGMMAPLQTIAGALKINLVGITTVLTVVLLVWAAVRHIRDKGELKELKGD